LRFGMRYEGVSYEITDKPWFGPQSRGIRLLRESPLHGKAIPPIDFLRVVKQNYPDCYRLLEFIRFQRSERIDKNIHQRFAICYTAPSYEGRQRLYDLGPALTNMTGGQPLKRWPHEESAAISLLEARAFGRLSTLESAKPDMGCSFVLSGQHSAIVLDFGFAFPFRKKKTEFGILTHTHRDHSGGGERRLLAEWNTHVREHGSSTGHAVPARA
jgi:hypothetical protein